MQEKREPAERWKVYANIFICRFVCPQIAVLFTSFFRAVFFFADLRRNKDFLLPEKTFFLLESAKNIKKRLKRTGKKNRIQLTISRFTCPEIAVLFIGSFQAVLFFCRLKQKKGLSAS